jgi:Zn-dependent protease
MASAPAARCPTCGTQLAASLLSCPACHRLVHSAALKELSIQAERAEAGGDGSAAMQFWRQALELLPPESRQHGQIVAKIDALGRLPGRSGPPRAASSAKGKTGAILAVLGTLALLAFKFKTVLIFLLTKGKLLLLGLTKSSTLFSMVASLGVYWAVFGWKFALGLIVSIYIHEMGHVAALSRLGIAATAPMFIPGIGAIIRSKQYPATPREDAEVGLAGPIWGLYAAIGALLVGLATGWASWLAIAHVGAWINLFNLMPIFGLDGGRGMNAMSRLQRGIATAALVGSWIVSHDGLMLLVAIVALGRTFFSAPCPTPERRACVTYVILVAALTGVSEYAEHCVSKLL